MRNRGAMDQAERQARERVREADERLRELIGSLGVDGHLWRQVGMTGSDHDECVMCGAKGGGIGGPADAKAEAPCERQIEVRIFGDGTHPPHLRVTRR